MLLLAAVAAVLALSSAAALLGTISSSPRANGAGATHPHRGTDSPRAQVAAEQWSSSSCRPNLLKASDAAALRDRFGNLRCFAFVQGGYYDRELYVLLATGSKYEVFGGLRGGPPTTILVATGRGGFIGVFACSLGTGHDRFMTCPTLQPLSLDAFTYFPPPDPRTFLLELGPDLGAPQVSLQNGFAGACSLMFDAATETYYDGFESSSSVGYPLAWDSIVDTPAPETASEVLSDHVPLPTRNCAGPTGSGEGAQIP